MENQTGLQTADYSYRKRSEGQQDMLFLLHKTPSFSINHQPEGSFIAHAYFGKRAVKEEEAPRYDCPEAALADAVELRKKTGPSGEIIVREFHKSTSLNQTQMSIEEWNRLDHDTRELPDPPEPKNWKIAGDGQIIELVQGGQ